MSCGGSDIADISLIPTTDIWSVLGIGVAVIVNTSTVDLYCFIFSLSFTPKRCSSSIINSPKSLHFTSLLKSLCVPITISTFLSSSSFTVFFCSFCVLNLLSKSTDIGYSFILCLNSKYCWFANTVVGAKYATCFPSITALNAALIATSVFPYPTSPHSNLSIGFMFSISFFTSFMQRIWSSVSWYGNDDSNSSCHGVSFENAYPFSFSLFAYNSINSFATVLKFLFTLFLISDHSFVPNLLNFIPDSDPIYFLTLSNESVGTYSVSPSRYLICI